MAWAVRLLELQCARVADADGSCAGSCLTRQTAGGCAGTLSWAVLHPVDVLKSCVQALPDTTPAAERTVAAVARKGFQEEGLRCVEFRGGCARVMRSSFDGFKRVLWLPQVLLPRVHGHDHKGFPQQRRHVPRV